MRTVSFAAHTAYIDDETGVGLLVVPNWSDETGWNAAVAGLLAEGWEPLDDGTGLPTVDSLTEDGREVVALHGRRSGASEPTMMEIEGSFAELRRLANIRDTDLRSVPGGTAGDASPSLKPTTT